MQPYEDYNFEKWTTQELFHHLIDFGILPYEEDFEDWRYLHETLLEMCQNTINYETRRLY